MHIGAGGIKGNLHPIGQHMRQQTVHTFGGGLDAHFLCALEAIGFRVDAHHPDGFQHGAALQFGQQVGANVARPDQGTFDFFEGHGVSLF